MELKLNIFILIGIFSLHFVIVFAKVAEGREEYDAETEAMIRNFLKLRRRLSTSRTTTTTPEPERIKTPITPLKGTAINLNIIVVPVIHERGASGRIANSEGTRPAVNSIFGDRLGLGFPTYDEDDDLEAQESSNQVASTPATGILNPTPSTPPSCRPNQRYDPGLRQCISSRGGACPKCGGRRRHTG